MARSALRRLFGLSDVARRITGFSTPFFGIQWASPATERDIVRALLTYLEDRRMLFARFDRELGRHSAVSEPNIRQQCTETLAALPEQSRAVGPLRAIRAACRRFHDEISAEGVYLPMQFLDFDLPEFVRFFSALQQLRASIGEQVAILATLYEIELEAGLVSIVPSEGKDGKA